ncbi:hypothetical protein T06_2220, partial [Trichinella sp. T6]
MIPIIELECITSSTSSSFILLLGLMALPSIAPEICVASLIAIIHHTSLVVRVAISAFGIFVEYYIRNHVDKYVITKHYYQLMPLSLA